MARATRKGAAATPAEHAPQPWEGGFAPDGMKQSRPRESASLYNERITMPPSPPNRQSRQGTSSSTSPDSPWSIGLTDAQRRGPSSTGTSSTPSPSSSPSSQPSQPPTVGGAGHMAEASIDQVNIAMRAMPWYQDLMRSFGQDPGHPTINPQQRQQVLRAAQANGIVVDEGDVEMDDHGNFNPKGHKLRNTLIVAGLAAATIATMGAAGAFAGAGAVGAGAGAGTSATLAGVEGAGFGLTAAGASGLGAATAIPALAGAGATAAGIGAGVGAGGAAAGSTAGGLFAAGEGPGLVAGSGLTGGGILGTAANIGSRVAPILGGIADRQAQGQQQNFQNDMAAAQLKLRLPAAQLSNLVRTSAAGAGPVQAHWGGPGSGLRGETLHYSGGANEPLPQNVRDAMPQLIDKRLQEALAGPDGVVPQPSGRSSAWDKILGGAAVGSSILGGFRGR